ncbi:MAG: hypothetical protein AB7Q37_14425 [Pyrinomonadaceae bacterium]
MQTESQNDIWEIEVSGQLYTATLDELPVWIDEGSLQPEDKVRKGNLRWIEARKVPLLIPFFNARARGERIVPVQTTTIAEPPAESEPAPETIEGPHDAPAAIVSTTFEPIVETIAPMPDHEAAGPPLDACSRHADREAVFNCTQCRADLCKTCAVPGPEDNRICPACGARCLPIAGTAANPAADQPDVEEVYGPFGFGDLFRAFAHPFKFRSSLVIGGLMFMIFSIGQSASSIGGIFFLAASIICMMLVNMMWFGVLANTIDNFVHGRLEADFLPAFDDFSLWEDVIHPFFLSIAAYISSFGPFVIVLVISLYLIASAAADELNKFNNQLTRVPGTPLYAPDRTGEQSREVREILERVQRANNKRLEELRRNAEERTLLAESDEPSMNRFEQTAPPEEFASTFPFDENNMQQEPPGQLATDPTTDIESSFGSAAGRIFRLAAPLAVMGLLALLWGFFYFPAACAVAGYSRSFISTINPAVGLDTIKRLGGSYALVLLMFLLILIASGAVTFFLRIIFFPFDLPAIGNIPAAAVGSIGTFYFSIVFSCILGYALAKNSRRLGLRP